MQVRKDKDADKSVMHKTGEGVHEEGEAEDSAPHCHQSGGGPFPDRVSTQLVLDPPLLG